ncbi:MAG TPA: dihydroorotase [Methanoregulaceae archaeon]|nr:dihydroorotase [Methanoregulaceae archaeon]
MIPRRCDLVLKEVTLPGGRVADLSISDGIVVHTGSPCPSDQLISCRGLTVLPGAIDMHVHMRGRVQSGKEDWKSGSMSAIAGGVTVVVDQPNTIPPLITEETFRERISEAARDSVCSYGINGGVLPGTDLAALWGAGAMAFGELFAAPSSYGESLDAPVLRSSLEAIGRLGGVATIHAEEVRPGSPRDLASHNRLRGPAGETRAVSLIAGWQHQCRIHFCHLSTASAVAAAGSASVEVTPHHLFLSYEQALETDTSCKVNPPLRTEAERRRLWSVWERIDVIASDHAPHTMQEKSVPFPDAPSGIPGVETMIPLLMASVVKGDIDLTTLIAKTSWRPSAILGIPKAGYSPGDRADFALYGSESTPVTADTLHSRAGWTPFEGLPAVFPDIVIQFGNIAYDHGDFYPSSPRWYPGRGYIGGGPT